MKLTFNLSVVESHNANLVRHVYSDPAADGGVVIVNVIVIVIVVFIFAIEQIVNFEFREVGGVVDFAL